MPNAHHAAITLVVSKSYKDWTAIQIQPCSGESDAAGYVREYESRGWTVRKQVSR